MSSALMPRPTYFGEKRVNLPHYSTNKSQNRRDEISSADTAASVENMDVFVKRSWTTFVKSRARRLAEVPAHSPLEAIMLNEALRFNSRSDIK